MESKQGAGMTNKELEEEYSFEKLAGTIRRVLEAPTFELKPAPWFRFWNKASTVVRNGTKLIYFDTEIEGVRLETFEEYKARKETE
jgi:hypothetical protein